MLEPLLLSGMHGLGDNLHQRSIVRHLMRFYEVWLETSWPCLYHDMPGLHLVSKDSSLRTQAKNAVREANKFVRGWPSNAKRIEVSYPPDLVRQHGSVLAAMSAKCGVPAGEFALPIPDAWRRRADALINQWQPAKPIMIYRPLVERSEWGGCKIRNPDFDAYRALFLAIREQFFVVSVADLADGREWIPGQPVLTNVLYHKGELDIEVLAALVGQAALVYTPPGFAAVLAQAVGTPSVVVFGGYENSSSFRTGAAPYLGIEPVNSCRCFSASHACDKRIDLVDAKRRLLEFVNCEA